MSLTVIIVVLFATSVLIYTSACTIEQSEQEDSFGDTFDMADSPTEAPSTTSVESTDVDYYARDGNINTITNVDISGNGNSVTINNYTTTSSTSSPSDTLIALGLNIIADIIGGIIIVIFECFWKKRH